MPKAKEKKRKVLSFDEMMMSVDLEHSLQEAFSSIANYTTDQMKMLGQREKELVLTHKFGLNATIEYKHYADMLLHSNLPMKKCVELLLEKFDLSHMDAELLLTLPVAEDVLQDVVFSPPLRNCIKCNSPLTTTGDGHITSVSYYTVGKGMPCL